MNTPRPAGLLKLLAALPAVLQVAACAGPGYYAQAVSGHLELMRQREDVAAVLAAPQTQPSLRSQLELSLELRAFAVRELGLPDNGSFTQFARTGREAVTWNVVATPELSLEPRRWCFLVAGCVPYRGYFEREAARRFAGRLAEDGFDVDVTPAVAYSTLGWFEDPLLDTMLRHGEEQLAAIMFHELAHQKVYLRGDTAFNESYASFIEETGVTLWLRTSGRTGRLPDWQRRQQAAADFDKLLLLTRAGLADVYGTSGPDAAKRRAKAAAFDQMRAAYRELVSGPWAGHDLYAGWFDQELNNARLALFNSYRGGICAFTALFHEVDQDMERFHARVAERAALAPSARRAWLERPCPAVASQQEL